MLVCIAIQIIVCNLQKIHAAINTDRIDRNVML